MQVCIVKYLFFGISLFLLLTLLSLRLYYLVTAINRTNVLPLLLPKGGSEDESLCEAENHMLSVPALDMYYGGHMDSNASQAAMAATERRLYALPIIRQRIRGQSRGAYGAGKLRRRGAPAPLRVPCAPHTPRHASDAGRGPFRPDGRTQGAAGGGRAERSAKCSTPCAP